MPATSAALAAVHPDPAERRLALVETAVLVLGFQLYALLGRPSLEIDLAVVLALLVLTVAAFRRRGETPASLAIPGASGDLRRAARLLVPLVAVNAIGAVAFRAWRGPVQPVEVLPGLVIALATYPIWGFLQQLFYLGFGFRGLVRAGLPPAAAAPLAGLAYGFIHAPNWPLTALCVALGLYLGEVYRRAPSLLAVALAHGIGGALALHVLGLDLEIGARVGLTP